MRGGRRDGEAEREERDASRRTAAEIGCDSAHVRVGADGDVEGDLVRVIDGGAVDRDFAGEVAGYLASDEVGVRVAGDNDVEGLTLHTGGWRNRNQSRGGTRDGEGAGEGDNFAAGGDGDSLSC